MRKVRFGARAELSGGRNDANDPKRSSSGPVLRTEIVPARVIRHQHENVGLLLRGCRCACYVTAANDANRPSQMSLAIIMVHFLAVDCPRRAGCLRPIKIAPNENSILTRRPTANAL